jgi:rare lipoprotein A (peptidoglycan hydrolase)
MHAITQRSHAKNAIRTMFALFVLAIVTSVFAGMSDAHAASLRATHTHAPRHPNFAPHIGKNIVVTRGSFLGNQVATWYGPGFFGHRTACGQTLRRSTWGIAHRSLPCGTLVTLTRGGKKVSVRVIDRGPYSGASLDLTSRTRDYLRFTSGSVKMAVVSRYRLAKR